MLKFIKSLFPPSVKYVNEDAVKEHWRMQDAYFVTLVGWKKALYGKWTLESAALHPLDRQTWPYGHILRLYKIFNEDQAFVFNFGMLNKPGLRLTFGPVSDRETYESEEYSDRGYCERMAAQIYHFKSDDAFGMALDTLNASTHPQAKRLFREMKDLVGMP